MVIKIVRIWQLLIRDEIRHGFGCGLNGIG